MVGLGGVGPDEARSPIVEGEGAVPGGQKPTDGLFFFGGGRWMGRWVDRRMDRWKVHLRTYLGLCASFDVS